jgi:plastocyanin
VVKRGKRQGIFGVIGVAAVLAALIAAATALAVAETIVATDNTFSKAVYSMDQGDRPALQNMGGNQHNATASANGPDGRPLFDSPTIGTGTTTLNGTQYLTTGTYIFICTIHPDTMIATLSVSGLGTPVPRPSIALKVLSKNLDKIASKGKLPVRVQATTASQGVELEAKLGKKTVGEATGIDLAAGARSTVALRLSKAARKQLGKKDKAKVKVEGTVPFGSPSTAKRKLR